MKNLIRHWLGLFEVSNVVDEYERRISELEEDVRHIQNYMRWQVLHEADRV